MAKKTKRKSAHPKLPMQRQLNLRHEGKYFDLRENFDRLNERFFRGRLRGYKVVWGRKRKRRPKDYFIFGTIQEEDRVIRINPLLDQPFVPPWFLRYILYRSEERRVGKECRSRCAPYHYKKKKVKLYVRRS